MTRWSKYVLLALAAGQLGLAIWTLPTLFRVSRRERLRQADWAFLVSASMLDLSVIVSVDWLARTAFAAPLTGALTLPDFRVMMLALGVGLA